MQPSRTATVCEVDRARKRAASRLEGSEPRIPDKPLETYHPETNRLTATCSCEACSAFTRVAARTLARSPICDQLHRRLQPFRHLHDCSGCFRLERSPGGTSPTGKRRLLTAHTFKRPLYAMLQVAIGTIRRLQREEAGWSGEESWRSTPIAGSASAKARRYFLSPIVASMNSIVLASPFNAASRVASGVAPM